MPRKDIVVDLNDPKNASKSAKEINDLEEKGWKRKDIIIPKKDNQEAPMILTTMTKGRPKKT